MKISIIIPTLNEELFLPLLLNSIKRQSFKNYEVIVADAHSSDNTVRIAEQSGIKVVEGGMPARGRNKGARAARGQFLFFLDADVILPEEFLHRAYDEMQERYLDLSTCEVEPLSELHIDRVLHKLANLSIRMGQYTSPHAGGFCILSTKRLFERVGGFNESLAMAEDHDYVKRASRFRPLRVLDSTKISVSVRRLEKEGRAVLVNKYLQVELHRIFKGELKTNVIEYEFGNLQKHATNSHNNRLAAFEDQLIRIDKKLREFKKRHETNGQILDIIPSKDLINSLKNQFEKTKSSLSELLKK
ncbi:MAG: glycosyltransferase [Deltaproteobacteria bacterium]|nr:glycosyltransferase [Deltaproteobacteria bacterium]